LHALRRGFCQPVLIGSNLRNNDELETINTANPEETLIDLMMSRKVDGVVRGSFKANATLRALKSRMLKSGNQAPNRIGLLQHPLSEKAIYLSPVGIEEGKDFETKKLIISKGIELLQLLGFSPKIDVLAAGLEPDDLGRDSYSDETIHAASQLVKVFGSYPELRIKSSGILVENSIGEGANFIIAPDGISGNLLYRTLVHVADWKSFGAVLILKDSKLSDHVYVDTSRIGTVHEYRRALTFASALAGIA